MEVGILGGNMQVISFKVVVFFFKVVGQVVEYLFLCLVVLINRLERVVIKDFYSFLVIFNCSVN